jgi:hypothetical protein
MKRETGLNQREIMDACEGGEGPDLGIGRWGY